MRHRRGSLPDLFFPADRSWLVSALWDDTWTCVGGPEPLVKHREDGRYRWDIRRARRDGDVVVETEREQLLLLPDGRQPSGWARGKVGRDEMLWLQVDGDRRRWYRYEIDAQVHHPLCITRVRASPCATLVKEARNTILPDSQSPVAHQSDAWRGAS